MLDTLAEPDKRSTRWDPSPLADQLKREYARAKRRRNRWGGKDEVEIIPADSSAAAPAADILQTRMDEINRILKLDDTPESEREALQAARKELVKQIVSAKFGDKAVGGIRMQSIKVPLPDNTCPGGALNLVGLIIGPRGKTQQKLQAETNCVIVVRGKGTQKMPTNGAPAHPDDDEPPHVYVRGPDDASLQKAKKLIEMLIDFNSTEGEKWRNDAWTQLRVLNGTLQEDKDIDYKRLFSDPQKAISGVGPLGKLTLRPTTASKLDVANAADAEGQAEYEQMMAEISELEGGPTAASPVPAPAPTQQAGPPKPLPTGSGQLSMPQHPMMQRPSMMLPYRPGMPLMNLAQFQQMQMHQAMQLRGAAPMRMPMPFAMGARGMPANFGATTPLMPMQPQQLPSQLMQPNMLQQPHQLHQLQQQNNQMQHQQPLYHQGQQPPLQQQMMMQQPQQQMMMQQPQQQMMVQQPQQMMMQQPQHQMMVQQPQQQMMMQQPQQQMMVQQPQQMMMQQPHSGK